MWRDLRIKNIFVLVLAVLSCCSSWAGRAAVLCAADFLVLAEGALEGSLHLWWCESSWRMRNNSLGLSLQRNSWLPPNTFLHPCVAHELHDGLKENFSVPQSWCCGHHWAPSKQKPLPELKGCLFSWLCMRSVLHCIMYFITALCTVPFKSCSSPCPRARARTPACPASPLQPQVLHGQWDTAVLGAEQGRTGWAGRVEDTELCCLLQTGWEEDAAFWTRFCPWCVPVQGWAGKLVLLGCLWFSQACVPVCRRWAAHLW